MIIVAFTFTQFLAWLPWVALALMNFWIWQKSKALGNLLMLIGAGVIAVLRLIGFFAVITSEFIGLWIPMFALYAFAVGFFFTVKPLIEAQLAGIKDKMEKLKEATSEKDDKAAAAPEASDSGDSNAS